MVRKLHFNNTQRLYRNSAEREEHFRKISCKEISRTSLVVQGLRIHLPTQGTRVRPLVRETESPRATQHSWRSPTVTRTSLCVSMRTQRCQNKSNQIRSRSLSGNFKKGISFGELGKK